MLTRFLTLLLFVALFGAAGAYAQSSATIAMFMRANAEVMLEGDEYWRTAKIEAIKDCIRLRDAATSEFFDFSQIRNIRTRKRGNPPGPWMEIPPVEIGAMRGCVKRNPI